MAKSGVLTVRLVSDTKNLEAGLAKAGKQVDTTGDKFANAGKKMTLFATVPIVAAMAAATNAASNLEQSMGAVESIFGDAVGPVLAFGETAADVAGLSKREVNEMAAVLGASLQGMGFEAGASAEKVVELQKRGADMAATFGGTTKDALNAIASLMRGERDPIEKYGVSIKAVDVNARIMAMGLDTSTAASKKNAEAVAGLDLLMEQTSKTQGQFARESDSTAGAQQRARAALENSAATLGEKLLPLAAEAADKVAFLAEKFGSLPAPVQNAVLALGGVVALAGPMLTVAGNVAKMTAAIQKMNVASVATKAGIIGIGVALAGLTVHAVATAEGFEEKIVKGFAKVTDAATSDLVEAFDQVGGSMEIFEGLAEANLTQAVRLRDGLKALGRDTSELDAVIDKHAASQRKVKADTEKAALAITGEGRAAEVTEGQVDSLTAATQALADAQLEAVGSSLSYDNALLSLENANAAVVDAQRALTEGGGDAAKTQRDLADATRAVEDAQRNVVESHRRVEDAQRGIVDANRAVEDAARGVVDAERRVEDAHRGIEDAAEGVVAANERIADSAERTAEAQEGLAQAQRDVAKAQKDLKRLLEGYGEGSKEAAESAEDLDDTQRALTHAELDLADAQENLSTVMSSGTASARDIERAHLRVADAEDRLEGATEDVNQAQTALDETINGVPASSEKAADARDDLREAEDRLTDAAKRVTDAVKAQNDAQRGLTDAQRGTEEAARSLEEAERGLDAAHRGVEEAARGVADAERGLDDALRGVADAERAVQDAERSRVEGMNGNSGSVRDRAALERDLRGALLDQKQAYLDAAQAYVDRAVDIAEANGKTITAKEQTQLFKEKLSELATTLAPNSPLRKELLALVTDLDKVTWGAAMAAGALERARTTSQGPWGFDFPTGDGPGAVAEAGGSAYGMAAAAVATFGGRITSGYRSPALNAAVGGSPTSYHIDRNNPAQDIVTPNMAATFEWLASNYGGQVREMIYGNTMIKNGRRSRYARSDHWDHIHIAHDGGVVESGWPTIPGLRRDERPVIAQVGEKIVAKDSVGSTQDGLERLIAEVRGLRGDIRHLEDAQVRTARAG